ncbi:MAG TPA: hypothetical protein VGU90_11000, partial [Terriglobales bacterium]|nr:hypothetical protein [Terriglobales bacterium]
TSALASYTGVKFREAPTPLITYVLYNGAPIAAIVALIEKSPPWRLGPLGTRWMAAVDLGYLVGNKAEPTEPECPKSPIRHPAVMVLVGTALPRRVLRIGPRGAGRQGRDRGDGAGLHIDLAAIVINEVGGATRSDHDRIADIGIRPAFDRRKTLALIDR